jgi:hypothetical protein
MTGFNTINTRKMITAGLVAGVIINVIDVLVNEFVLGNATAADLTAVSPMLWSALNAPANIALFVAIDFVLGLSIVWLYAAIRPRYGPGAATAVRAAAFVWLVASLMWIFFYAMGLSTLGHYLAGAACSLVNYLVAGLAGGRLYGEPGALADG